MRSLDKKILLDDRKLFRIDGPDAASFLQNIMSNDIAAAQPIVYSCLLSPQGQFLHDFFVIDQGDGAYLLDVDAGRADDLIRRLNMFRLRAKVTITADDSLTVYAGADGHRDPRHAALGGREYRTDKMAAEDKTAYSDFCISIGVPPLSAIRPERDVLSDINLDLLNAVGWDKGCFIGQEVTARMKYRGLAKKRLMIIAGNTLPPEAGDIRVTNSSGTESLAIIKLSARTSIEKVLKIPDYLGSVMNP